MRGTPVDVPLPGYFARIAGHGSGLDSLPQAVREVVEKPEPLLVVLGAAPITLVHADPYRGNVRRPTDPCLARKLGKGADDRILRAKRATASPGSTGVRGRQLGAEGCDLGYGRGDVAVPKRSELHGEVCCVCAVGEQPYLASFVALGHES